MKAPVTTDLAQISPSDLFSKTIQKVKTESGEMKRASYTLTKSHLDYINLKSVQMAQERGKNVSASEALRVIIEEHSKGSKS